MQDIHASEYPSQLRCRVYTPAPPLPFPPVDVAAAKFVSPTAEVARERGNSAFREGRCVPGGHAPCFSCPYLFVVLRGNSVLRGAGAVRSLAALCVCVCARAFVFVFALPFRLRDLHTSPLDVNPRVCVQVRGRGE